MDDPNQPQDATPVVPPATPAAADPQPTNTPSWPAPGAPSAPPPGWPPPPAHQAAAPPAGSPIQPWSVPAEPVGPAPGVLFAPHGARLVAYIVDGILVSVLVVAITIALAILTAGLAASGALPLAAMSGIFLVVAIFAVSLGYFPWFWVNGGATPGMRIFSLRVVRDRDGGPIGWGEAILRLIGLWIGAAVFYLGYVWILIDSRHRGWHDLIAGTLVIQPAWGPSSHMGGIRS